MTSKTAKTFLLFVLVGCISVTGWAIFVRFQQGQETKKKNRENMPVPVEVAPIEHGPIRLQRTFSGELEATAEFVVAPKVSGRVKRVLVHIADRVKRGQIVAELDNDEYVQAVAQAMADLDVARAQLSEAKSALEIAVREFKRTESLLKRGIASDSEFDAASRDRLARQAQLKVAAAQVAKAQSSLKTEQIREGYTKVTADWSGGDNYRVVAERYVDEGQTVAANTPLLLIVELHPIIGVVFVTEKDYGYLKPGQHVSLKTDACPGEVFTGTIKRIAPVFRKTTRQARVEMAIDNSNFHLKPGMFIKAAVTMKQVSHAVIVPEQALTRRNDRQGLFLVTSDGKSVVWKKVRTGIREGNRIQVEGDGISGKVVILGQQMVDDGARIYIPGDVKDSGLKKDSDQ